MRVYSCPEKVRTTCLEQISPRIKNDDFYFDVVFSISSFHNGAQCYTYSDTGNEFQTMKKLKLIFDPQEIPKARSVFKANITL